MPLQRCGGLKEALWLPATVGGAGVSVWNTGRNSETGFQDEKQGSSIKLNSVNKKTAKNKGGLEVSQKLTDNE